MTIYGGLNYLALFDPDAFVIVQCCPVFLSRPGDRIDLYWKDSKGEAHLVGTQPIGDGNITVSIKVPTSEIRRFGTGIHAVYYLIVDTVGNYPPSQELPVTIKLTVPGDPYGAGENDSATPYINEALRAPTVAPNPIYESDLPLGATVTIPPWVNMFEGDVLTLNWGGLSLKQDPLQASDIDKEMIIKVDLATHLPGGSSNALPVRYEIRDIVNNWSLQSLPDFVNVHPDLNLLDAPDVVDEAGGELDYDSLAGAVAIVTVDTTQVGINQGDSVTLYWEGTNAQGASIVKDYTLPVTTTKLRFQVPNADVALFIGGNLSVSYTVFPRAGGTTLPSRSVSFTVLGEQKDLPAPELLDGVTGTVFEPATLPASGARVTLDPYPGMAEKDRIILSWAGKNSEGGDVHGSEDQTLDASDVNEPFVFNLEKDEFLSLGDATELTFSYTIIFASSGGTRNSEKARYNVKQAASGVLKRPEVQEATSDDMLDPADPLFTKANVQIPDDVLLLAGDRIDMLWDSPLDPGDTDDYMVIKTDGKGLTFQVPKARVEASLSNEVRVSYTLTRGSSKLYESKILTLFIGNADDRLLPAPTITEVADGSHMLDPADVSDAYAHVVIKAADINVAVGDQVLLNWAGNKPGGSYEYSEDISGNEAGKDVTFDVPKQYVDANLGGTLTVDYTVIRGIDGSRQSSHPLVLGVGPNLTIDTSTMLINSISVKAPWPVTGQESLGNSQLREANGGIPPYTYSSSNTQIASVSASGMVTRHGNGSATIYVEDDTHTRVSYPVSLSNVWLVQMSPGLLTWGQSVSWMNGLGAQPMSVQAIADITRVYTQPIPPTGSNLWCCSITGCSHLPGYGLFCNATTMTTQCVWHEYLNRAWALKPYKV